MKSIKKMAFMFLILACNVYGGTVIENNDCIFLGTTSFSNDVTGIDIGLFNKPFRHGYFVTNYLEDYPLSKKKAEHWDTSITNNGVVLAAGRNITLNGNTSMIPITNGVIVTIADDIDVPNYDPVTDQIFVDKISGQEVSLDYATASLVSGVTDTWHAISVSSNGLVVAAWSRKISDGTGYIYIGTNGPNSLVKNTALGLQTSSDVKVTPDGSKIFVTYYQDLKVTTNNGSSWTSLKSVTGGYVDTSDDGSVILVSGTWGTYMSTNSGSSFTTVFDRYVIYPPSGNGSPGPIAVSGDGNVLMFSSFPTPTGPYRYDVSTNRGVSFTNTGITTVYGAQYACATRTGNRIYLTCSGNLDNGQGYVYYIESPNYNTLNNITPKSTQFYRGIGCSPDGRGIIALAECAGASGNSTSHTGTVYVSTNYGATFSSPTNFIDVGTITTYPRWLGKCAWGHTFNGGYAVRGGAGDGKIYKVEVGSTTTNSVNILGDMTVYGSVTAEGGFFGDGSGLTNITAAQVGAVATNDARYLAALTNASAFATASQGVSATNAQARVGILETNSVTPSQLSTATNATVIEATNRVAGVGYLLPASTQNLATVAQVTAATNTIDGAFIASKGGVTNGGCTINGAPITNGAAFTITGYGGISNISVAGVTGTLTGSGSNVVSSVSLASLAAAGLATNGQPVTLAQLPADVLTNAWQNPVSATNWMWTKTATEVTLTNYTGPNEVVVPDMLDGLPVTGFANNIFAPTGVFETARTITSVSGGNNVRSIPANAFRSCAWLTNVSLSSVTSHGTEPFYGCSSLKTVSLPSLLVVGDSLFENRGQLTTISLTSATQIRARAFSGCSQLTTISLPSVTVSVGSEAFRNCTSLTSIYFKNNRPSVGPASFDGTPDAIIYVTDPQATGWETTFDGRPVVRLAVYSDSFVGNGSGITNITASQVGAVATNDERYLGAWQNPASASYWTWTRDGTNITLTGYTGPDDVFIPDMLDGLPVTGFGTIFRASQVITNVSGGANIKTLAAYAFSNCAALASVSLPNAVTIGDYAFYACTNLSSVILPSATTIGIYAFPSCTKLASVSLPSATTVGGNAFASCATLASVSLPNVTTIGNNTFNSCTNLASVTLPNATIIGAAAFSSCTALKSVSLPNATTVGNVAFNGCASLNSVSFAQNAPTQASNVYLSSPNATNYVTNPTATGWGTTWNGRPVVRMAVYSDSFVGNGAGMTNITAAQVGAVATNDARYLSAWKNPASASYWTWTSDGTNITLTGYTGPNAVVIPDMLDGLPVTGFGTIFQNSTVVTNVSGGANIKTLSDSAFSGCTNLISVNLPNATTIGNYALNSCSNLTSLILPNSVTIGNYAFSSCTAITSAVLPNATTIGNSTFFQCTALTSANLPNAEKITASAFSGCTSLTSVYFAKNAPAQAVAVYNLATNVTNYVTSPIATGWGTTWNGRPVVRMAVYSDSFVGNGAGLTNITAAQVGAVATNDARYLAALTNESDTLASVLSRGSNANGLNATNFLGIQGTGIVAMVVPGASYSVPSTDPMLLLGKFVIAPDGSPGLSVTSSPGSTFSMKIDGRSKLLVSNAPLSRLQLRTYSTGNNVTNNTEIVGSTACEIIGDITAGTANDNGFKGAAIRNSWASDIRMYGNSMAPVVIEGVAGSSIRGAFFSGTSATNKGIGSIIIGDLTGSMSALIDTNGDASILLGAGVVSNRNSIVAGDGQVSHGDGSITAGGGFFGSGSGLTGMSAAQVGAVATNDARYLSALTNAWQNPSDATNWTWTKTATEVTLTGYTGPNAVVIPDMLDGLPVTGFGTIFQNSLVITNVSGGENIKTLAVGALSSCTALKSVSLPNATTLDNFAFSWCTNLTSVSLPNATTLGIYAFNSCTALTSVSLPNAVTVGNNAFYGCSSLTSVYFAQNAPTPASNVYLSSPNVTNYVTSPIATGWGTTWNGRPVVRMAVYSDSFVGNGSNLTGITASQVGAVATNDERYLSAWQNPADASYWTWTSDGTNITLTGYTGPNAVVIPDMLDGLPVTVLGVALRASTVTNVSGGANIKIISNTAFSTCGDLISVSLPNATTIGDNAFSSCGDLTYVSIPNAVTIGNSAFSACSSLTSVYFVQNAPTPATNVYIFSAKATNYVTNPTATGWGTTWNGRPVVRMAVYSDSFVGNGSNLTGITASQVGAVATNDARYLSAWQNPANASYWTWTSDGTNITLTGYTGPNAVFIPDMLDALPVTGLGQTLRASTVTNVSGGANIKTISGSAFRDCIALASVSLPNATTIGTSAFSLCTNLASVSMPNATTIGNSAFASCTKLASVSLPNAVTIGPSAFISCSAMASVSLPSATTIGDESLSSCSSLTSVYFAQNAPAQATDVYLSSPNVTNYVTNPTATGWGSTWNGRPVVRMAVYSDSFVGNGAGLTNITAAQVGAVATNAPRYLAALTNESDTLSTVLSRGNNASSQSAILAAVMGNGWEITTNGIAVFGSGMSPSNVNSSARGSRQAGSNTGSMSIGVGSGGAQQNVQNKGSCTIGLASDGAQQNGALAVGSAATNDGVGAIQLFDLTAGQVALTTSTGEGSILLGAGTASNQYAIVAGDGQVSHGDGSITAGGGFFGNGAGLTNITAAQVGAIATNDAKYLASLTNAWQNPASSTNWTWTKTATEVTLTGYTGTANVFIPDMLDGLPVTVLGEALRGSTVITNVSGGVNINTLSAYAFSNCTALTTVSLPNAVTIGNYAFYTCTNLTSVSLPSATTIGIYTFNSCTALTSVSLPRATTVGNNALASCAALTSVSLPNVTTTGNNTFNSCTALTSVSLPSATTIGAASFSSCTNLTSASLPNVTVVGASAFSGCLSLNSVYFAQNAPTPAGNVYLLSTNATNYVTNPTATGWGTTWNGRPVVRMAAYSDSFVGNGAGLTNITAEQVGAATTSAVSFAAAPACYQITLTNTSALSWTNTWMPTSKVSRVTLTSTGTVTFVWNWPTQQDAGMRFALDRTGMPSVVFPAGAIYLTNGIYGTSAPVLGRSNYVSVIHDDNTYQIMVIPNTLGNWGTP